MGWHGMIYLAILLMGRFLKKAQFKVLFTLNRATSLKFSEGNSILIQPCIKIIRYSFTIDIHDFLGTLNVYSGYVCIHSGFMTEF